MIDIDVLGLDYQVPSNASDTNWAAKQLAFEQALAAAVNALDTRLDTLEALPLVKRLYANVTPVGTGADTTEDDLMSYALPAGTLSSNGKGVRVTAWGTGVFTADQTLVRCYFGATAVVSKILEASQANTWRAVFEVLRTGASTQVATGELSNGGIVASVAQENGAPAEALAGSVTIKLTGQRLVSSVADSIRQLGMVVELIP